jgi:hypothetical protein
MRTPHARSHQRTRRRKTQCGCRAGRTTSCTSRHFTPVVYVGTCMPTLLCRSSFEQRSTATTHAHIAEWLERHPNRSRERRCVVAQVYSWGTGGDGQLGQGFVKENPEPARVQCLPRRCVQARCVCRSDDVIQCWCCVVCCCLQRLDGLVLPVSLCSADTARSRVHVGWREGWLLGATYVEGAALDRSVLCCDAMRCFMMYCVALRCGVTMSRAGRLSRACLPSGLPR